MLPYPLCSRKTKGVDNECIKVREIENRKFTFFHFQQRVNNHLVNLEMAEAKSISDLYFQQRGFNIFLSPSSTGPGGDDDDKVKNEENFISFTINIPKPRMLLRLLMGNAKDIRGRLFRSTDRLYQRLYSYFVYFFWPIRPETVAFTVFWIDFFTIFADSSSWLRSGSIATWFWRADKVINRHNPFHKYFSINFRTAYLSSLAGLISLYLLSALVRLSLKVLLSWRVLFRPYSSLFSYWASAVKFLSGSLRPTSAFQRSLPTLPLPNLHDTCTRYIESIRPIVGKQSQELSHILEMIDDFLANEGPNLHIYLWMRWMFFENYISDLWTDYVYLRSRAPIMIHSNYYVLDDPKARRTNNQVFRAANLVHHLLSFKDHVENETLEPLTVGKIVPLCMHQYKSIFGTSRIPGVQTDTLKHTSGSRHIIVIRRGKMYKLNVYHSRSREPSSSSRDASSQSTFLYSSAEIAHQLQLIKEHANLEATGGFGPSNALFSLPSTTASSNFIYSSDIGKVQVIPQTLSDQALIHKSVSDSAAINPSLLSLVSSGENDNPQPKHTDPQVGQYLKNEKQQQKRRTRNLDTLRIVSQAQDESLLPALTAWDRPKWAEIRNEYFSHGINKKSLDEIDSAAFVLVLDSSRHDNLNDRAKSLLHGNGFNRWFDKSLQLVVFEDGSAGLNAEHSWGDAPVVAHLWEFALLSEQYDMQMGIDAASLAHEPLTGKPLPMPRKLRWEVSNLRPDLLEAQHDAEKHIKDLQLAILEFTEYGKQFMQQNHIHPDSYVQLALQLAYVRDRRGKVPLTYEACMTRLFSKGRTETVRSFTSEALDFIQMMCSSDNEMKSGLVRQKGKEEKINALRRATEQHQHLYREAMEGQGVDRHLFGLYVMSKFLQVDSPFLNYAMSQRWNLSTSQQPQVQTKLRERLDPEVAASFASPGGGFGPVDDYGVSYMIIHESKLYFHVTSSKSKYPEIDVERFIKQISRALKDMRKLFE